MLEKLKITGVKRRWLLHNVSILAAVVLVCAALIAVVLIGKVYEEHRVRIDERANTAKLGIASTTRHTYQDFFRTCSSFAEAFPGENISELQFIDTNGRVVSSSSGIKTHYASDTQDIAQALSTGETVNFEGTDAISAERVYAVSVPMQYEEGKCVGVLRYVSNLAAADNNAHQVILLSMLIARLVIALIVAFSLVFLRSILEPVLEITAFSKRIAAGSYGVQIDRQYDDEIGELADTINDMSVKLGVSEKTQSEFISSVSHELRTPLTAISGWSETLLAAGELNPEMRRGILIIQREAKRLTGMVEELLEFTRMQNGRFTLNVERSDITAEFEDTVYMYGSRLKQEGIKLNYDPSDEPIPEVSCDISRLRQVFLNILDNAVKHGGDGKKIDASLKQEGTNIVIRIRDYGPGIPEEELPNVKKKFYKGSSKARGSGIGLAVCEEIVTLHRGTLTLQNAEGGGTLVTIMIPIWEE